MAMDGFFRVKLDLSHLNSMQKEMLNKNPAIFTFEGVLYRNGKQVKQYNTQSGNFEGQFLRNGLSNGFIPIFLQKGETLASYRVDWLISVWGSRILKETANMPFPNLPTTINNPDYYTPVALDKVSTLDKTAPKNEDGVNIAEVSITKKYSYRYINQSKTEFVKFACILPPYDDDNKSLAGVILQGVSGACTFIVDYVVRDNIFFVSASIIEPSIKNDADIYAFASMKAFKNNKLLSELKLSNDEAGFWDASKGQEPVGSCKLQLPNATVDSISIELTMGYSAQFPHGSIYPIPYSVKHPISLITIRA